MPKRNITQRNDYYLSMRFDKSFQEFDLEGGKKYGILEPINIYIKRRWRNLESRDFLELVLDLFKNK